MDRYLPPGYRLKNPSRSGEYEIKELIGTGASCAVYYATFLNDNNNHTEHLLKEYNPRRINLKRDETGSLQTCKDSDIDAFEEGLHRFQKGYERQMNVRLRSELKNTTSNIQTVFDANGTRYIDMTVMEGKTYNKIEETSLYDLLRRLKAITEVVSNYHSNGLLHLDIKPENIFTIPETVEMVQMFDFDSVMPKADVARSVFLSYTQSWAAQEQILPNRRNQICEATDFFAIGEMLFFKLMGRHSESHERRSFSTYQFDYEKELLRGVNPRVFALLSDILQHTICNRCSARYQTAAELLEKLTEAIALADPKKAFLKHSIPPKAAYFVGREAEMHAIDERLKLTDKLLISGMGGMGKSELAKQYAHAHKDEYDAVIFAVCDNDLESMIADDSQLPICNVKRGPDEKASRYFSRKLEELEQLCNERVLLIVDNFNDLQDKMLDKLLRRLNCKMLFTTRCDVTEYNYEQILLSVMSEEHVWSIFRTWYKQPLSSEDISYVQQIIDLYQGHTMAVELIAKQMRVSNMSPKVMLEKLNAGGFSESGRERVVHAKDGANSKLNIHAHIRLLFDVSDLSEKQVYILANLSLMPASGISRQQFHDWCKLDSYCDIEDLAESGWVRQDEETGVISLHPVIADMMLDELEQEFCMCEELLYSASEYVRYDLICADADSRSRFSSIAHAVCCNLVKFDNFPPTGVMFINVCSAYFAQLSDSAMWIRYLKKAFQIYRLHGHGVDEYSLSIFNNLAVLYHEAGQLKKAEKYYNRVLKESVYVFREGDSLVGTVYNNLATLYMDTGKLAHARKTLKKAIEYGESQENETVIGIATRYDNLGVVYQELEQYPEAISAYTKAQELLYLNGYGKSDVLAVSYSHLSDLYFEIEDYVQSELYLKKALDIWRWSFGEDSLDTAIAFCDLGLLYRNMKKYSSAIECLTTSVNICKKMGEDYKECAARAYSALGKTYADLDYLDSAEACYQQSLSIRSTLHPVDPDSIQIVLDRMDELQKMRQQKTS